MGVTLRSGFSTMDPSDSLMDLVANEGEFPPVMNQPSTGVDQQVKGVEAGIPRCPTEIGQYAAAQQDNSQDGGFTLVKRKIVRSCLFYTSPIPRDR